MSESEWAIINTEWRKFEIWEEATYMYPRNKAVQNAKNQNILNRYTTQTTLGLLVLFIH